MLVRLWWKEARVFGPVALLLLVSAGLFQWLMVSTRTEDVHNGGMTHAALCWAVLYAFAVAAASFTGERESNTLGFLDALPVPRSILWLGKASFALGSTVLLSLLLIGLSEFAMNDATREHDYSWSTLAALFLPLLVEGLAWGLFWSALSKNTLIAAVLSVISVMMIFLPTADERYRRGASGFLAGGGLFGSETLAFAGSTLFALLASLVIMTWRPSKGWRVFGSQPKAKAAFHQIQTASISRSLFWQVAREGGTTALLLVPLALFIPVTNWIAQGRLDGISDIFLATLAFLVAGVSVFGTENALGSRSFLVHHGVSAWAVWWRRFAAWTVLVAGVMGLSIVAILNSPASLIIPGFTTRPDRVLILVSSSGSAYAIGVLCGMVIRRRITAIMVGTMLWVLLVPAGIALMAIRMIPVGGLALVPLMLMAVSAAWAGDWLREPDGLKRWGRLFLFLAGPFTSLAGGFIGYRAFSEPDLGPVATLGTIQETVVPAEQNAAEVYRKAAALLIANENFWTSKNGTDSFWIQTVIENGWNEENPKLAELLAMNQPAMEQTRKASVMPRVQFEPVERMRVGSGDGTLFRNIHILQQLIALEVRRRQKEGNLSGAWDDLMVLFRMSLQMVQTSPTSANTHLSCFIHRQAVGLATEWLADSRQDATLVRKALADLKALPELPDLSRCLKVEAYLDDQAFDLPGDELAILLFHEGGDLKKTSVFEFLVESRLLGAPWERERARRICRRLIDDFLAVVAQEPYQRPRDVLSQDIFQPGSFLVPSLLNPLVSLPDRLDQEHARRRMLLQQVALLAWKLEHDGKDAESLGKVVPEYLAKVPIDPFSGGPFGYAPSEGQRIWPWYPSQAVVRTTRIGQMLLYARGRSGTLNERGTPTSGEFLSAVP